jgi:uncharacterized protein (TIGR02466 family)
MNDIQEVRMFFTPLFYTMLDHSITDGLKEHAIKLREEFKDNTHSAQGYGGWHSPDYVGIDNLPKILQPVFSKISSIMEELYTQYGLAKEPEFQHSWYHINSKYSYTQDHLHAGAFFSGVLYIDVPPESGDIVFIRDNQLTQSEFGNYIETNNEYNYGSFRITPQNNLCVFFPWHVQHRVEQNLNQDNLDRIVMAFNYK